MKIKQLKIDNWVLVIFIIIAMTFGFALGMFLTNSPRDDNRSYWDSQALIQYLAQSNNINSNGYGSGFLYYVVNSSDYAISCYQRLVDDNSFENCCRDGQVTYGNVTHDGVEYGSHEIVSWGNIIYQDKCYNFTYAQNKGD